MTCECCSQAGLPIPGHHNFIHPGDIVILGRFSTIEWRVGFGWFSYDGNRKICGWFLTQLKDHKIIKPIQETDLSDIYTIYQA